jgi:hypothetical protein
MTVYLVISLPQVLYIYIYIWFKPLVEAKHQPADSPCGFSPCELLLSYLRILDGSKRGRLDGGKNKKEARGEILGEKQRLRRKKFDPRKP